MKKTLTFVDLEGTMYTYAKPIYRKNKTHDADIIALNDTLNKIIQSYAVLPATGETCMQLWAAITTCFKKTEIEDKDSLAYKELVTEIDNIGYSIAYLSPRKGLRKIKPDDLVKITFNDSFTDSEKIEAIKKYLVYLFKYAKEIHDDNTDYEYYLTITNEELLDYYNTVNNKQSHKKEEVYGSY